MKIEVGYPNADQELAMLRMARDGLAPATLSEVGAVTSADRLLEMRHVASDTEIAPEVLAYLASVVRHTRSLPSVELGASPRASVHLLGAAKAIARMSGRDFVTPDDVARMATPVLRHRILVRPEAELERYSPDDAVKAALAAVPVPR
jgi:MoxR-like ATPase